MAAVGRSARSARTARRCWCWMAGRSPMLRAAAQLPSGGSGTPAMVSSTTHSSSSHSDAEGGSGCRSRGRFGRPTVSRAEPGFLSPVPINFLASLGTVFYERPKTVSPQWRRRPTCSARRGSPWTPPAPCISSARRDLAGSRPVPLRRRYRSGLPGRPGRTALRRHRRSHLPVDERLRNIAGQPRGAPGRRGTGAQRPGAAAGLVAAPDPPAAARGTATWRTARARGGLAGAGPRFPGRARRHADREHRRVPAPRPAQLPLLLVVPVLALRRRRSRPR
jgi:hypothetical protein